MLRSLTLPFRLILNPTVLKPFYTRAMSLSAASPLACHANPVNLDLESLKSTSKRWLYNNDINDIHTALRRLEFDVEALGAVAAEAGGAAQCKEIACLAEGSYNRVFRLTLSNDKTVIARIPFPNAGPRSILTRSEVATMDFVRARFDAPIPKVLAWDATNTNTVGCEYIIMEQCPGTMLLENFGPLELYRHIADIAELMTNLAAVRFSQYGSIYYKEDVDAPLRERGLYADGEEEDALSERFRIGPSVERRFYRGGRAGMDIDRGPWKDINSYLHAAVNCEIEWMRLYSNILEAKAQLGVWHTPERHTKALQKWLALAPAVLPSPEYCAPTLSHPDLHAGNVFVTGTDPLSVSGFIDWQGASVRPLFETRMPNIFEDEGDDASKMKYVKVSESEDLYKPVLPENYAELSIEEKEEALTEFHHVWPRHAFYKFVRQLQGPLFTVLRLRQMVLLKQAVHGSSRCWSEGLPALEQTLMMLSAEYGDGIPINSDYPVCPVVFSEEDEKHHEKEFKVVYAEELLEARVRSAMEKAGIFVGADGAVDLKELDATVKKSEEVYAAIMAGKSEAMQESIRRRWPIREGKFVYSMESCI